MADIPPSGKIITFYSYKGGTGRSMALANVGYLLAETLPPGSRGVLMIDWDLEAPGLHRYFEDSVKKAEKTAQRTGIRPLALHPGLIDFFESADTGYGKGDAEESRARALASLPAHVLATDFDNLHLLKAGRFDDAYPDKRFRVGSSDLLPLVSFPLASRINGTNERLRVTWRNGALPEASLQFRR